MVIDSRELSILSMVLYGYWKYMYYTLHKIRIISKINQMGRIGTVYIVQCTTVQQYNVQQYNKQYYNVHCTVYSV